MVSPLKKQNGGIIVKTAKLNFLWFEEENRRKVLRASVCTDNKLHLGEELRKKLPTQIRYGFDKANRILAIAEGRDCDIKLPKNGILNASALSKQFREIGIALPLVFEFEKDDATGFYLGHIVPQRQTNSSTPYNAGQLMLIYEPLINRLVDQLAKTTPKAERRAIAMAALCEAVEHYDDSCGELGSYIQSYLQQSLITENRQYTESFRNLSFDAPLRSAHDGVFSLSHIISDQYSGGISQAETRIMAEQFQSMLSEPEQHLIRLMQEDLRLPQIALELELAQEEVIELGRKIGEKRKAFCTVA